MSDKGSRRLSYAEKIALMRVREGKTPWGQPVWSDEEIAFLKRLHGTMTYADMSMHMPKRSMSAISQMAQKLKLTKPIRKWSGAEISKLRRIYQRGTREELKLAFPGVPMEQIIWTARKRRFRRPRRYKQTGIPVIDQVRDRALALGYSMVDVDAMAGTNRYFQTAAWHKNPQNFRAIGRAVHALGGRLSATWED